MQHTLRIATINDLLNTTTRLFSVAVNDPAVGLRPDDYLALFDLRDAVTDFCRLTELRPAYWEANLSTDQRADVARIAHLGTILRAVLAEKQQNASNK